MINFELQRDFSFCSKMIDFELQRDFNFFSKMIQWKPRSRENHRFEEPKIPQVFKLLNIKKDLGPRCAWGSLLYKNWSFEIVNINIIWYLSHQMFTAKKASSCQGWSLWRREGGLRKEGAENLRSSSEKKIEAKRFKINRKPKFRFNRYINIYTIEPNWKVVPTFTLWLPVNLFRNLAGKCELQSSFQDAPHQSWRAPASLWHFLPSMGCWWSGHTDHNHTRRRAEGQSGDPGGLTILSPTWCSSNFTTPSWCCRSSSAPSSPPRTSSKGSI